MDKKVKVVLLHVKILLYHTYAAQLPEWEVTRRTPSEALLREACPPTAQPHRRPDEGNSEKSPPCWDYRQLQLSVPYHLITLRPTPSYGVVWLQSGFPRDAYVGLVPWVYVGFFYPKPML